MKKVLSLFIALSFCAITYSQCGYGSKYEPTKVTAGVIIDWSLKSYRLTGFSGIGVHGGIWADHIGLFAGYVESKLNDESVATREIAATIAIRYSFLDDRLVTSGYFSNGTHNYQDIGFRAGYDIWNNGIAVGAMVSRTMHYGLSIMISMKKKD